MSPVEEKSDSMKSSQSIQNSNVDSKVKNVMKRHAPEIGLFERRNWLLYLHYVRKEFDKCKSLTKDLIQESDGMCEYALHVQALILREEGEIQHSLEMFQQCQKINQTNPNNLKQVARSLFLLGRHKMSITVYEEALKLSPKDWEVLHNMGVCYYYLDKMKKARELLYIALSLSRHDVTSMMLGKCFLKENDVPNALDIYRKAVEFSPENPELLTTLGLLHLKLDQNQKAFEKLGKALVFQPGNVDAVLAIGAMIQQKDDYDVAQTKYRIAASEIPMSPFLWNNIGMCFFGKKKNVAAISCLKRAAYLAPFEWTIIYNLGLVHLTMQQYASAFHYLSAAITLYPKNANLFALLAVALTHLNSLDDAKQAYEQAILCQSNDPSIFLNYAVLLNKLGDSRGVAQQLSRYKQADKYLKTDEMMETGRQLESTLY